MAWLDLFEAAGMPDVRGWVRVEQSLSRRRGRNCHRAWVQRDGARSIALTDDLRIEYGGSWFARWPASWRVEVGAYGLVRPTKFHASERVDPNEVIVLRPGNLLTEALAEAAGRPDHCIEPHGSIVASVARASWVRALGHRELAQAMVAAWPIDWSEDELRTALTRVLIVTSDSALRQGAPRSIARPWLSWAASEGRGPAAAGAKRALELLGDDLPPLPADIDAAALVAALPDDLLYPDHDWQPRRHREKLGWPPNQLPRSPAFELLRKGWQALPALVESPPEDRLMRGGILLLDDDEVRIARASALRRNLIEGIAAREFTDDADIEAWWKVARERGELDMMIDNLSHPVANVYASVARLVEHHPAHAAARLSSAWDHLSEARQALVMTVLVDLLWVYPDEPTTVHNLPGLDRLVRRAFASRAFAVAAPAAEASRRLGHRGWVRRATRLVAARLAEISDEGDEAVDRLCDSLALAAPARLAAALAEAHASPRPATREAASKLWWRSCSGDADDEADDEADDVARDIGRRCVPHE